jgi:hypothetical protein
MRHSKNVVAAGTLRKGAHGIRRTALFAALLIAAAWTAYAFVQEGYVGHRLTQQVADLRRQNVVLASQNAGYRKDVQAITSGTASEEEARLNGYARPSERLYLVTATPTPAPPSPTPSSSPSH